MHTRGVGTDHDLSKHWQDQVLNVAVAGVRDNEHESGNGIWGGGLHEHGGDGNVRLGMVLPDRPPHVIAHVEQSRDEKQGKQDVETDGDREVRNGELDRRVCPQGSGGAGRLEDG